MAISVNGGNGSARRRFHGTGSLSEINVTPFVDVVLVLLIIFMMTAHAMESGLEVEVPETRYVKETVRELPIVKITSDGKLYLNDQVVNNIHNLAAEIRRRFAEPKAVYLVADKATIWDVAVQVMAQLAEARLSVSVVTQPEDQSKRRR